MDIDKESERERKEKEREKKEGIKSEERGRFLRRGDLARPGNHFLCFHTLCFLSAIELSGVFLPTWLREKGKSLYLFLSNPSNEIPSNNLNLVSKHLYIMLRIIFNYTLEWRLLVQ